MKKIIFILLLNICFKPVISQTIYQTENDSGGILLDWPDIPGATQYQLQVSPSSDFIYIIINVSGINQSQYQIPDGILICNTLYYWHYRAFVGGVWQSWSNIFQFVYICTGIGKQGSGVPDDYILYQNYPNPFNPSTTISFSLPKYVLVRLTVFDINGKEIKVLINEPKPAGNYSTVFNAENLPSGIYFYSISAGDFRETKKMVLIK